MMRACTLWNPWAWSVVFADKDTENRPKSLGYVGQLAVHVGLHWDREEAIAVVEFCNSVLQARGSQVRMPPLEQLYAQRGQVIGVVSFAGWYRLGRDPLAPPPADSWAFGPWCCRLEGAAALREPVMCRGYQGIWTLPPDVEQTVRAQLQGGVR